MRGHVGQDGVDGKRNQVLCGESRMTASTCKAQNHTNIVSPVGSDSFHTPEPDERYGDIDTSVGSVGTARRIRIDQGEHPRESDERGAARKQPEDGPAFSEPCPE